MADTSMKDEVIAMIKALGYRAFMNGDNNTYAYYTDGVNVGYCQWSRNAWKVSTVNIPCMECGTGFVVANDITKETLKMGFQHAAAWATQSDRNAAKKFKDWDAFLKSHGRMYPGLIEV